MSATPDLHDADNDVIVCKKLYYTILFSPYLFNFTVTYVFFYLYHSHLIFFQLPVRHYETVHMSSGTNNQILHRRRKL